MDFETKLSIEILLNAITKRATKRKKVNDKIIYKVDDLIIELYYNNFRNLKTLKLNNKKSLFINFDKFSASKALKIINTLMDTVRKFI